MDRLKKLIETIRKVILDGVLSFFKDLVKKKVGTIITIILGIAGTVTVTNPEFVGKTFRAIVADKEAKAEIQMLHESLKQLRGDWKASEQTNFYERRQFALAFKSFAEQTDKSFRILHDSLMKQNKRLEQFSKGQGTVAISGGGEVKENEYSDAWIDAVVEPTPKGYDLIYNFSFKVKDVTLQYYDDADGSRKEVFSVKLESLKDSSITYNLNDYERWTMTFAEEPTKPAAVQPDALSLNVGYSGYGAEIGLSYSLWNVGGFRFIDLGISSDFQESTNISAGARYNIGNLIPLLQDLYIGIHYGYNLGKAKGNPVLMVGTTI